MDPPRCINGCEEQLEFPGNTRQTAYAVFAVMDHGDLGGGPARIQEIRKRRLAAGERASEIVVIHARKKLPAGKREKVDRIELVGGTSPLEAWSWAWSRDVRGRSPRGTVA